MKFLSVCSGIEAASVAWAPLGWKAWAFSEIEPFPCSLLAQHYPDVPNLGDMTKYQEWPVPDEPIDLLCGGTPCQSFSVAGLRTGLDDPRGNLMLTYLAIADKYRPRWLVWENVPGVLSSNGGRDFGAFLGALGQLGYGWAYRILDAQYFGVAQRRRRVFVVGHLGDWRRAAAVLFERHSLQGHPAPRREKGQGFAVETAPSLVASGRGVERTGETRGQDPVVAISVALRGRDGGATAELGDDIGNALRASNGGGDKPYILTSEIVGQAMSAKWAKGTAGPAGDEHHNLIPVPAVTHYLRGEGHDASEDGTGRGVPLVVDTLTSNGDAHSGFRDEKGLVAVAVALRGREGGATIELGDDQAFALRASSGGGDKPHVLSSVTVLTINDAATRHAGTDGSGGSAGKAHGLGIGKPTDPMYTLTKGDKHAIAIQGTMINRSDTAGPAGSGIDESGISFTLTKNDQHAVQTAMQVRRLTPVECERLMGFPDEYTQVPNRNKPAADGPRYKALGNSWAVPCARWIGERIAAVDAITELNQREAA